MIESVLLRLLIISDHTENDDPSIDWQIMEPKTHGEFLIGKSSQDNNSSLDELDPTNNMWKDIMYWKEY